MQKFAGQNPLLYCLEASLLGLVISSMPNISILGAPTYGIISSMYNKHDFVLQETIVWENNWKVSFAGQGDSCRSDKGLARASNADITEDNVVFINVDFHVEKALRCYYYMP